MDELSHPDSAEGTPTRRSLRHASGTVRSSPYPQTSRIVSQIRKQSPNAATIKRTIPDLPNVPTGPRALQQSSAGPIRRNRSGNRQQPAGPGIPPDFGSFMMANGLHPEIVQQMMMNGPNFQQMMAAYQGRQPGDRISDAAMEGTPGIVLSAGDRSRCRHWPRCQLGPRCKFHHPHEICPYTLYICKFDVSDYPNCPQLAGTCPKIHVGEDVLEADLWKVVPGIQKPVNGHKKASPKVNGYQQRRENQPPPKAKTVKPQEQVPLCKFAHGCTKPDCPFAHPTPAAGDAGLVLKGEMCPDARDCLNKEVHPRYSRLRSKLIEVRYGSSQSCS